MRAFVLAAAFATLAASASAQPAPAVQRIERGALRVENVPETPADVRERLNQYVNTRAAAFQDWTPGGGILIATRFGDTNQLHRVVAPMGDRTQLTFYDEPVGGAAMRPNANTIFFTRDVGGDENFSGFLFDPATGRAQQFTAPNTRNLGFRMSDDGALMAWASVSGSDADYDIYVGDPANPTSRRRVLEGEGSMAPLDFSADKSKLLIGRGISIAESQRFVLDVASGRMTRLTPEMKVSYNGGEFTPDGRAIILMSDEDSDFQRIVRLDLATGTRTVLAGDAHWDVESFDLSDDGNLIAYTVNEAGASTLHILNVRTGRALMAPTLPAGAVTGLRFDHQNRRVAFTLNSATAPGDVYAWDTQTRRLTRWTQSEVGGLNAANFVAPTLISWRSFDNREITGFLYTPRTPGPHPVIINIHGGPEGQSRPTFSSTIQYWVNELGVAVILPNVRGSTGYGGEFLSLDNADKREDSVRDIGALLDWVGAQGALDKNRVLVYGGSYGGYMVLASMTHYNDRLAGGVDIVGISNWLTFLQNTSAYRRDLRRVEYGDERDPAMRATFQRISPLTNIRNVTKPMFVVAGFNDPRVPYTEGEQVTRAIRANGGDVWFMMGMNEGHGFRRRENQQAQREAETLFFRRVLGLH